MFLNRLRKEMSLSEITKEEDTEVRLNKLYWFMKRKFLIGSIISLLTFLLTIVIKAGAYRILNTRLPFFQLLVIAYVIISITFLIVILCFKGIKEEKEKHFNRWAHFFDLYNFFMECICVLLLIMIYLFSFVRVSGPSMKPTYRSNDVLVCRSIGYKPKKKDVVIVYMKKVDNDYAYNIKNYQVNDLYVKRIVAAPGDTITYDDVLNTISVNGEVIESSYSDLWYLKTNTITLAKDEYFIMGDNRGNSTDSRSFGPVKKSDIVGKALFNLWFWR